jgi:hypothetical protein
MQAWRSNQVDLKKVWIFRNPAELHISQLRSTESDILIAPDIELTSRMILMKSLKQTPGEVVSHGVVQYFDSI